METKNIDSNRAVIYARVSSREQKDMGYSIPAQVTLIENYADRCELEPVKVFEVAESADGKKEREIFRQMMEYTQEHQIKHILCEKVDRLTRNMEEAVVINSWFKQDSTRQVHFAKQHLIIHKNAKSDDIFKWDIEMILAKKYVNNLSEEVKKGQKEKIAQGWFPAKPPLGYKTGTHEGKKIPVINMEVAPYIKKIFKLYNTGNYSILAITNKVYESGFRSRAGNMVAKSAIHKVLLNPFYYGAFIWNNVEYKGRHKPLISKSLFDEVQSKMRRGSAPYARKHKHQLRGKVFCGNCEKMVTWEYQRNHWYGGCKQCKAQLSVDRKYVRQEILEEILLARVSSVAPANTRVLHVLQKALKESHSEEIELYETEIKSINNILQRNSQRKDLMYSDRLDGRINPEMYDIRLDRITKEDNLSIDRLKELSSGNTEHYKVGVAIHELAKNADTIYLSDEATSEDKALLLSYAFSNISILQGNIKVEYTKGFEFLHKWMPEVNNTLEQVEYDLTKGLSSQLMTTQPVLQG